MPISAYEETNAFKVYACDCGLLRRLAHLPASVVTDPIANFTEFKGAMAENAVLQSMMPLMDDQKPIIGHHLEQQKWSLSYSGMTRLSPLKLKQKITSLAAVSLYITRRTLLIIVCAFRC